MWIVGIDPGVNTGIVIAEKLSNNNYKVVYKTVYGANTPDILGLRDRVQKLVADTVFVVEAPPQFSTNSGTQYRYNVLIDQLHDLIHAPSNRLRVVSPGEWKPIAKAQRWARPVGWTRHEVDAYNLIRYYLYIENRSRWREWRIEYD